MRFVIIITKLISHGGSLKLDELSSTLEVSASRCNWGKIWKQNVCMLCVLYIYMYHFDTGEITIARETRSRRKSDEVVPRLHTTTKRFPSFITSRGNYRTFGIKIRFSRPCPPRYRKLKIIKASNRPAKIPRGLPEFTNKMRKAMEYGSSWVLWQHPEVEKDVQVSWYFAFCAFRFFFKFLGTRTITRTILYRNEFIKSISTFNKRESVTSALLPSHCPRFTFTSYFIRQLYTRFATKERRINKKSIIVEGRTGLEKQSGRKLDSFLFMATRHGRSISWISLNRTTVRSIIPVGA